MVTEYGEQEFKITLPDGSRVSVFKYLETCWPSAFKQIIDSLPEGFIVYYTPNEEEK